MWKTVRSCTACFLFVFVPFPFSFVIGGACLRFSWRSKSLTICVFKSLFVQGLHEKQNQRCFAGPCNKALDFSQGLCVTLAMRQERCHVMARSHWKLCRFNPGGPFNLKAKAWFVQKEGLATNPWVQVKDSPLVGWSTSIHHPVWIHVTFPVLLSGLHCWGLPYAAAPVNDLRWRPPQAMTPWKTLRSARAFGNNCLQAWRPPKPERWPLFIPYHMSIHVQCFEYVLRKWVETPG